MVELGLGYPVRRLVRCGRIARVDTGGGGKEEGAPGKYFYFEQKKEDTLKSRLGERTGMGDEIKPPEWDK